MQEPLHGWKGHALAAAGIFLITSSDATKSFERTASILSRQERTYADVTWSFFSLKKCSSRMMSLALPQRLKLLMTYLQPDHFQHHQLTADPVRSEWKVI